MNKTNQLNRLKNEMSEANLPLKNKSINIVFGKGNPDSSIMMVGEAPGKNEDLQGLPFVGAAGRNLDKLIEHAELSLNEIYVTNILKYKPPDNRDPANEEIKAHTPWLIEQIKIIRPGVICSLGNYATKFFLAGGDVNKMDLQQRISSVHGKVKIIEFQGMKIKLIPLFHPAAIIYNRRLIPEWEKDMEIVKGEIKQKSLI